jgi:hypothetical protein
VVKQGERLCLRFGVYLHSAPLRTDVDLAAAWRNFLAHNSAPVRD